jgi:GST-like protein
LIELYYFPTPNGVKIAIMLEETGLRYKARKIDIRLGEQLATEYLEINPNNKIPALVDNEPVGFGAPIAVFESGAMLEYLADKSGKFLAAGGRARYAAIQWVHWQMANLGPMVGNAAHFKHYAPFLTQDKSAIEYGDRRFSGEVDRNCAVLERQLSRDAYLAGDVYSIADMASWPWVDVLPLIMRDDNYLSSHPMVSRWRQAVGERPAVQRAKALHAEWNGKLTDEQEALRRRTLFNQDAKKVADAGRTGNEASALKGSADDD